MIFSYYYLDLLLFVKEIFLICVALFSLSFYTVLEKVLGKKSKRLSMFRTVSLFFIILFNIYLYLIIFSVNSYFYFFNYSLTNLYGADFFKFIFIIFFIILFHANFLEKSFAEYKYIPFESVYILFFFFLGMFLLLYSFDFLMIFLNLELQNFSLYLLINIQRNKKMVVETCIKYYVIGEYRQR